MKLSVTKVSESGNEAVFRIEGLPRGFGNTVGNGLRRTLIESIAGAAVTNVKVPGIYTSYTTIDGVTEDFREVQANLKALRFRLEGERTEAVITAAATKPGKVTAGDLGLPEGVSVVDPSQVIFTADSTLKRPVSMTIAVRRGVGYVTAAAFDTGEVETIALDARFTPIRRASYSLVDDAGVQTDTVQITVATDGSRTPDECLSEAAAACQSVFGAIAAQQEGVAESTTSGKTPLALSDEQPGSLPAQTRAAFEPAAVDLDELIGFRLSNTMRRNGIRDIPALLETDPSFLLNMRNFGAKSLKEVHSKLAEAGYGDRVTHWEKHF